MTVYTDTELQLIWQNIQEILKKRGPLKIKQLQLFFLKKRGLRVKKWEQQAIDADWNPPSGHFLEKSDPKFMNVVHEQLSRSNLILTANWKLRLRDHASAPEDSLNAD